MRERYELAGIEHTLIDIHAATMEELAQLYADFSNTEVRVPAALRYKTISPHTGAAAPGYVLQSLKMHLSMLHVAAVAKGGRVVVFEDTTLADAAREEAQRPTIATEEEKQRAADAMSIDRFWKLIDSAVKKESGCMAIADSLQTTLRRLPVDEILGFQLRLEECLAASYRWDLWAVAYIVKGGCSDDGFEYFRGWLISQGRAYFEAALADPERASDRAEGRESECEAILYVAQEAFAARVKRPVPHGLTSRSPEPLGEYGEEEDLPKLYPRLME